MWSMKTGLEMRSSLPFEKDMAETEQVSLLECVCRQGCRMPLGKTLPLWTMLIDKVLQPYDIRIIRVNFTLSPT